MGHPAHPPRANRPEAPRACRVVHRHNGSNSAALPSSTATAYSGQRTAGPDGLGWICDTDCKTWPLRQFFPEIQPERDPPGLLATRAKP